MMKLIPKAVERPWGGSRLSEVCGVSGDNIGEAWIYEGDYILKWLDARENLSVQNHPSEPGRSKREAWYIVEAPASGKIVSGWRGDLDFDYTEVHSGDLLELPAGCVHALLAGGLVLEIQEPLDVTWRIHDWGRGRELHLEQALRAISKEPVIVHPLDGTIEREEFTVHIWNGPAEMRAKKKGVVSFVAGPRLLESYLVEAGENVAIAEGERGVFSSEGSL